MAAPGHTVRTVPTGFKMPDGFKTLIACSLDAALKFWEITVKPHGFDMGGGINTTTMLNTKRRTKDAPSLYEVPDGAITAAYDPDVLTKVKQYIGTNTSWTIWFPDQSYIDDYGFLDKFDPQPHKEKEMPIANITIVWTGWDPVNRVEVEPVFHEATGT